jgi:hypothetical protein
MIRSFLVCFSICIVSAQSTHAQKHYDTLVVPVSDSTKAVKMQAYPVGDKIFAYQKPPYFGFVTKLPRTFVNITKETLNKKSLPTLGVIAASSLALIACDQKITDGVQQFSNYIGLDSERKYKTEISFNVGSLKINAYELPQNLNSVLYSVGEGSTSILICGGLLTYGKITNDYRSRSTASQIMQAQLAVGVIAQLLKRVSGRQTAFYSTQSGGVWHPFVNWGVYQKNVSHYDAFPSGHLATMMATLIVIADNYPEKKWIKPLGYTLMALTGFAMINNGVHWAGDYPLGLGIGYICGKVAIKMNRAVFNKPTRK